MKISIICATIGPLDEVNSLIKSLIRALEYAGSLLYVEFILVDQSSEFSNCHFPAFDRFQLIHIRNPTRGLSLNRNIGLERASGDWGMLIDSDCSISEDYFRNFVGLSQAHPEVDHFLGQIVEPCCALPLFRNWPREMRRVSKPMLWYFATSVNSIFRMYDNVPCFDVRFGLGARYGSCEDIDFFLRLERTRVYAPKLVVFHPNIFHMKLPAEKLDSYSFGFGALCAKHVVPLGGFMLFGSLVKKLLDVLRGRATLADLRRAAAFRLKGFLGYIGDKILGGHA